MFYLHLAELGGAALLEASQKTADYIAEGWNANWRDVIYDGSGLYSTQSGLYAALCYFGSLSAVFALVIWGLHIGKDYIEKGVLTFVPEVIWPLTVLFFLKNNGTALAIISLNIRDLINTTNEKVLTLASKTISLQEAYQQVKGSIAARREIGGLLKNCQALAGESQLECLKEVQGRAQEIVEAYNLSGAWIGELIRQIGKAVVNPIGDGVFALFGSLIGAAQEGISSVILISCQIAFQNLLEVSLLLTALLAPMAMGLSLLPVQAKPIFAWLTAMCSLGIAKLSFNIIVGLVATVIVNADSGYSLWYLILTGILAPILAFAIARGGGLAVWGALTNSSVWALRLVVSRSI